MAQGGGTEAHRVGTVKQPKRKLKIQPGAGNGGSWRWRKVEIKVDKKCKADLPVDW